MNSNDPNHMIQEVIRLVESSENSNIRLKANGGNSILLVCDPPREGEYIESIQTLMSSEKYHVIDLISIICEFVSTNKSDLDEKFSLLKGSIPQIFKIPEGEEGEDLFNLIMLKIQESLESKKIPVIIHSGALFGSGIDNIHIMESKIVMNASVPTIILYPATSEKGKLMFLGSRPASRYRCHIVE